jgi:hypothetical protein
MKRALIAIVAAAAVISGPVMAQASKFDASWDTTTVSVKAEIADPATVATCTNEDSGTGTRADPCVLAETTIATLDVAQQKDLLIGVSGQIGLVTFTQAKGKHANDGTVTEGSATAGAGVNVTVMLKDADSGETVQTAAPGPVTFAARIQELKVSVPECSVPLDLDGSGTVAYDADCEVLVSLMLNTTAAHHFNFIGVDLDQGTYDVVAQFDLSAFVAIVGEDAAAEAEVVLGPRMVTVQEVRAAKGSLTPLSAD